MLEDAYGDPPARVSSTFDPALAIKPTGGRRGLGLPIGVTGVKVNAATEHIAAAISLVDGRSARRRLARDFHALLIPYADFRALVATGLWIIAMSIVLFPRPARAPFAARSGLA